MASEHYTYSLYQITDSDDYFLLRVTQPSYSNIDQSKEDMSVNEMIKRMHELLQHVLQELDISSVEEVTQIGMFQGLPAGEILYEPEGIHTIETLWYTKTTFSPPWIFLSAVNTEQSFWDLTKDDMFADDMGISPNALIPPAYKLTNVRFYCTP